MTNAFVDKLYVIGGQCMLTGFELSFCKAFDAKNKKWNEVSGTEKARRLVASAVYEGKN